jgi:hypothetical protein
LELSGGVGTSVEDGGVLTTASMIAIPPTLSTADLEPNLRVVDSDSLEIPSPVPNHSDSGVRTVDGDVSDGELLISDIETDVSAVDNEVTHKTTTEGSDLELVSAILVSSVMELYLPFSI